MNYSDDIEDDYDDEDDDYLFDEDDWEVAEFPESIKEQFPGWFLLKITNFHGSKLADIDQWLYDNCKHGQYKRVGWRSGCSSSVGVAVENSKDAMMFRLRWN